MTVRGKKIPNWVGWLAGGVPASAILTYAAVGFIESRAVTKAEFKAYVVGHQQFGDEVVKRIDDRLESIDGNVMMILHHIIPPGHASAAGSSGDESCVFP